MEMKLRTAVECLRQPFSGRACPRRFSVLRERGGDGTHPHAGRGCPNSVSWLGFYFPFPAGSRPPHPSLPFSRRLLLLNKRCGEVVSRRILAFMRPKYLNNRHSWDRHFWGC